MPVFRIIPKCRLRRGRRQSVIASAAWPIPVVVLFPESPLTPGLKIRPNGEHDPQKVNYERAARARHRIVARSNRKDRKQKPTREIAASVPGSPISPRAFGAVA